MSPSPTLQDTASDPEHPGATSSHPKEVVVFHDNDPEDPRIWTVRKKASIMLLLSLLSFAGTYGSSAYAPGELQIEAFYGVSQTIAATGLTTYVLGFAFGPLIWGPLSEMYGRRFVYLISWPLLIVTVVPSAFVPNVPVILVFRLFTGMAAACALNNGSGVMVDMFSDNPKYLARASSIYAFAPLSGPCFGSLVSFFVEAHSHGSELWVLRVHLFFVIAIWPLVFLLPETHGPTILTRRARRLRKSGENPNAYAEHELHGLSKWELVNRHMLRPVLMLVKEPIVMGAGVWISLAYGILYIFFELFPIVYNQQHGIPLQFGGVPFLSISIGMIAAVLLFEPVQNIMVKSRLPIIERNYRVQPDTPEGPLKAVLVSCALMPIALFWFAWTSQGSVSWGVTIISGLIFGYAMLSIFFTFITYSSRTYTAFASSATAANTLVRSIVACFFPLVAHPLVNKLGTQWGISLFAFLSFGLLPIPIIFIRYGASLRVRSKYAQEALAVLAATRKKEAGKEEGKPEVQETMAREGIARASDEKKAAESVESKV